MFTRILKFCGIQKSRLQLWQCQIIWECQRKSRKIYEVEPEAFSSASVRKNPYEILDDVNEIDLREYQVKFKLEKEH